jgi:hypothetical protein
MNIQDTGGTAEEAGWSLASAAYAEFAHEMSFIINNLRLTFSFLFRPLGRRQAAELSLIEFLLLP